MASNNKELDKNMHTTQANKGLVWQDMREFDIEGKGWANTENFYDRLPAYAKGKVPDPVWNLSKQSAGMAYRFVSNSKTIAIRWTLKNKELAKWHMPSTGVSGIDLYAKHEGKWRWAGISRNIEYPTSSSNLAEGLSGEKREYMIYLPLYNGVKKIEIGIENSALLKPAPTRSNKRKICFYGTSILQGASASRPGMAHASILGRELDCQIINLGFSGNGKMEIELADLLGELNPSVYVIDCLPNMTKELIEQRFIPFAKLLRQKQPDVPIIFVDSRIYTDSEFRPTRYEDSHGRNKAHYSAIEELKNQGVKNIHHIKEDNFFGQDGEASVDGSHPTDLGFMRMANALEPVLRQVLSDTI